MKITIEHEGIKATIEADYDTLPDIVENIIKPALLAVGFSSETIDECLDGGENL